MWWVVNCVIYQTASPSLRLDPRLGMESKKACLVQWISCLCDIINLIFKQGIGIAEKSQETRRDCWGGNVNHKSLFDSVFLFWKSNFFNILFFRGFKLNQLRSLPNSLHYDLDQPNDKLIASIVADNVYRKRFVGTDDSFQI